MFDLDVVIGYVLSPYESTKQRDLQSQKTAYQSAGQWSSATQSGMVRESMVLALSYPMAKVAWPWRFMVRSWVWGWHSVFSRVVLAKLEIRQLQRDISSMRMQPPGEAFWISWMMVSLLDGCGAGRLVAYYCCCRGLELQAG